MTDTTIPGCRPFITPPAERWPYNEDGTAGLDYDAAVWTAMRAWDNRAGRAHIGVYAWTRDEYIAWAEASRRRAMTVDLAEVDPEPPRMRPITRATVAKARWR